MEHLPAFPVKSVDSTGAGDAFIGSFAVFLGEGLPESEAVRRANLYAGLSTTGVGTQKSFYDRARFDTEWAARRQILETPICLANLCEKLPFVLSFACSLTCLAAAQQKKIKVIADQDSAGPQGTNFLSLLMLLRAPQIDLLGITTVSGDQWMEPATVFALWGEEQAGRSDVPVIKGAEMPLLNTPREQELRESLYGSYVGWHGSFNPDAPNPKQTWAPPGGYPKLKPKPGRAADFIADTIRANPGEVVLYCAGPLTNIALAIRMDPEIVSLTKSIYIMGGSSSGGPELNWWWDPEAASIVFRAPWKQIVVSPFEAGGAGLVK